MESYKRLLQANRAWVEEMLSVRQDFFSSQADRQAPEFLWIGCSDSRVPAEDVTGAEPGDLFVHRNVANLVVDGDFNLLSVLQYAVEVLEVRHVIVCGHYHCGGVKHAMSNLRLGLIDQWLDQIRDLYRAHQQEIDAIADPQARWDRLVEINVIAQVRNLARTSIVQDAWRRGPHPTLHGWIYDLRTGYLKETTRSRQSQVVSPQSVP